MAENSSNQDKLNALNSGNPTPPPPVNSSSSVPGLMPWDNKPVSDTPPQPSPTSPPDQTWNAQPAPSAPTGTSLPAVQAASSSFSARHSGTLAGLGMFITVVGYITGGVIWLYTAFWFFADGQTLLGVIALVIPPADLVLPFLISPTLGIMALATVALMFIGSAVGSAADR